MKTKLFVFRSPELFEEYKSKSNWFRRCSKFMDPTKPFSMEWDGIDYTRLGQTEGLFDEFLMYEVFAFNDQEHMERFVFQFVEEKSDQENINQTLLFAIQELTIEIKRIGKVVDQIRFSQQ